MRARFIVTAVVGLLAAGCTGAAPQRGGSSSATSAPVVQRGQIAPDFTLAQATGSPVTLSDLHGKPVLLYFSMGPG